LLTCRNNRVGKGRSGGTVAKALVDKSLIDREDTSFSEEPGRWGGGTGSWFRGMGKKRRSEAMII